VPYCKLGKNGKQESHLKRWLFFVIIFPLKIFDFCTMNVIRFEKVVEAIDAGELVKIQYVSLDIMRKTGGKLRTITGKVTKQKIERSSTEAVQDLKVKKRNHYSNFTRIFTLYMGDRPTSSLKPVHLPLILMFNDKRVML
jgi:hypothetical protein